MIHAKDIMVGDWVILYGSLTRWGYTDYAKWHNEMERTDIHAVKPVRITPEILKKNGFDQYGEIYICEKKGLKIQIRCGAYVRVFCAMDMTVSFNRDFYVHRLQHALRLCGIEKEIEL